jgi:aminopeptidase N
LKETVFQESVKISTYLVALVIADFKCKYKLANAGVDGKVNVSVCGREDSYENFDLALDDFVQLLEKYEKLFGIQYPFSKCGMLLMTFLKLEKNVIFSLCR